MNVATVTKRTRPAKQRYKMRKKIQQARDAIAFWQELATRIAAGDGSALAIVNQKIGEHEAAIAAQEQAIAGLGASA